MAWLNTKLFRRLASLLSLVDAYLVWFLFSSYVPLFPSLLKFSLLSPLSWALAVHSVST